MPLKNYRICWLNKLILFFIACVCFSSAAKAKAFSFSTSVYQSQTNYPIPYAHLIINDGTSHYYCDEYGYVHIDTDTAIYKVVIQHHQYLSTIIVPDTTHYTLPRVELSLNGAFNYLKTTPKKAQEVIQNLMLNKAHLHPQKHGPYSFKSYNKFYFTTDNIDSSLSKMKKILNFFSIKLKKLDVPHHFLLLESITESKYYNAVCEQELILDSRFSGVDKPTLLTVSTQIQPFTIYDNFIRILSSQYVSPLAKGTLKRYHFDIIDSAYTSSDTIYTVKFNSKLNRTFLGLKGLLYVSKKTNSVIQMILRPTIEKSLKIQFIQKNREIKPTHFFPTLSITRLMIDKIGINKNSYFAEASSYKFDIKTDTTFDKKQFTEIVYAYQNDKIDSAHHILSQNRQLPLSTEDSSTYIFFDTVGTLKNIRKVLRLSERLYYKQIPFKFINIDTKHFFGFNKLEGLRLGIGAHTNDRLHNRINIGGYIARGLKDRRSKYGGDVTFHLSKRYESNINLSHQLDVQEAGGIYYPHDAYMYSSESARKLQVAWMDKIRKTKLTFHFRLFEYVRNNLSIEKSNNHVLYNYAFKGEVFPTYNFVEIKAGFKYTYGEKFLKLYKDRLSLGSKYPKIWFNVTKGITELDGSFSFWKYDAKLEYTKLFLGLGETNIQITAGIVNRDLPYFKLYNGHGSRQVRAVAHNSFETMGYNEFLSSKYISCHLTHMFGALNFFKFKNYKPKIEYLQNIGFGTLLYPQSHSNIDVKTMEKGFFESGISINNLLMFRTPYIRTGLGAALFYRYGAYANPQVIKNMFLKVAINFQL